MGLLPTSGSQVNGSITDYLRRLLTEHEPYVLSGDDRNKLAQNKVQFITGKIGRKKFRRHELVDKTRQAISEKVAISIKEDKPLHFVIPFGGYKHFWNPSYPEPDWAELFNFRYLAEYVAPVLAVHKPGVIIEYMSEDVILNRMNNYPQKALDRYSEIFRQVQSWYSQYIPKNLKFRFFRVGERCKGDKIVKTIEKLLTQRRKAFAELSKEQKKQELHRSFRSVFWGGDKDLTNLSEHDKEERVIESRLIELAYYETESKPEFMGNYLGEDNHICICFSFGTTHDNDEYQDLTLGSTYGSLVDFWIGRGILTQKDGTFRPRIISRNQYAALKNKLETIPVEKLLPLKNYQSIGLINNADIINMI